MTLDMKQEASYTKRMSFKVIKETEENIPKIDFEMLKQACLGKEYDLTLIFTDSEKIKHLNTVYRDKEEATDILSFPYSEKQGEIYISLKEAEKEAPKFDREIANFLAFLFIHGCVHLKGHDHGSTMENIEAELRRKLNI